MRMTVAMLSPRPAADADRDRPSIHNGRHGLRQSSNGAASVRGGMMHAAVADSLLFVRVTSPPNTGPNVVVSVVIGQL